MEKSITLSNFALAPHSGQLGPDLQGPAGTKPQHCPSSNRYTHVHVALVLKSDPKYTESDKFDKIWRDKPGNEAIWWRVEI